jgi:regulator of RNase E activity RraB
MGLRKETVYAVADFDAVYAWAKTNPKVIEAVEKVAIQAAKAGVEVPGISKSEVEKAA